MLFMEQQSLFAWNDADDAEVRHIARSLNQSPTILALDAVFPREQKLYPAGKGHAHLLWLDAREDVTQLWAATLRPDLVAELGPNPVSDAPTRGYDALPDGEGGLLVVWSGGLLSEPTLTLQTLDARGRVRFPVELGPSGEHPALVRTLDGMRLVWRGPAGVMLAELRGESLAEVRRIAPWPDIAADTRLIDFRAAVDHSHLYLFWNLVNAEGYAFTLWTRGPLKADVLPEARDLRVAILRPDPTAPPPEIGFNVGRVARAALNGERSASVAWAAPLSEPAATLPVAFGRVNALSVAYFQAGEIVGYQGLVSAVRLLRPPRLSATPDRHLALTWAMPDLSGGDELRLAFTTTRR